MTSVVLSHLAKQDLDDIWFHIALDNEQSASHVVDRLLNACYSLRSSPERGRSCPEFGAGMRRLVVGKYLIFYRVAVAQVEVARVLHGARNLAPLLDEE